jgi:hypothetical protein
VSDEGEVVAKGGMHHLSNYYLQGLALLFVNELSHICHYLLLHIFHFSIYEVQSSVPRKEKKRPKQASFVFATHGWSALVRPCPRHYVIPGQTETLSILGY